MQNVIAFRMRAQHKCMQMILHTIAIGMHALNACMQAKSLTWHWCLHAPNLQLHATCVPMQ